jgi:Tfp pilus assembly protein PilO
VDGGVVSTLDWKGASPPRVAEIGDDWSAEDIGIIVDPEEELKQRLRLSVQQVASLEKQLREQNDHIRELQAMVHRAHADPIDMVIASMEESIKVARVAKVMRMDLGLALRFVRELKKAG